MTRTGYTTRKDWLRLRKPTTKNTTKRNQPRTNFKKTSGNKFSIKKKRSSLSHHHLISFNILFTQTWRQSTKTQSN